MKNQLLLISIFFLSLNASAQVKFEKGYFVDESNNKVECLIKNYDWLSAPNEIEYQLSDKHEIEVMSFDKMNAFQIVNTPHYYIKSIVEVDKNFTVKGFNPKSQIVILKVILEGQANLYFYSNMFFYNVNDGKVKQLVYKNYDENRDKIEEDNSFRRELYDNLKCDSKIFETRKIAYSREELVNFFKDYNSCNGSKVKIVDNTKTKFNFKISLGLAMTQMSFPISNMFNTAPAFNQVSSLTTSGTNILFGFEAEAVLPFNKRKWSVFIAPNYQKLEYEIVKDNVLTEYSLGKFILKSNYTYIDFVIGARHYFYLSEKSKIFLDAGFDFIVLSEGNETKIYEPNQSSPVVKSSDIESSFIYSARIGLGYNYNDRYSLSLNYHPKEDFGNSEKSAFSFIASYKLF